jgi:ribose/xylose/arabinose/galactoside ABC-type transport system permease subunit
VNELVKSNKIQTFAVRYIMYALLILMILFLSIQSDKFLTMANVMTVLRQISIQSIVAIGMTMIIILAQIDLSVGSIVAFSTVINALALKAGLPVPLALVVTLAGGAAWGAFAGTVIARFQVHAFLVTLALMTGVRGIAYFLTGGYPIGGVPKEFNQISGGFIGPVPYPVIYMIVIYAFFIYIMGFTAFGRSIYAIGGNKESARLSGINVQAVTIQVFMVSSMLSALAGFLLSSRLIAGSPDAAQGWEMDVIAATVIGGTSMYGGAGKLQGTIVGMLFIGVLSNGMVLLSISPYMQDVIKGVVILLAVILNSLQSRKSR